MLLALLLAATASFPVARGHVGSVCLRYEPDTVWITGRLVRHAFYGPPSYGEDPKHDEKETGFYLELAQPVCTIADRSNAAQRDVRFVQLVLDSAGYARLRPALGTTITLRGTLFAAFAGHHHAPILLTVAAPGGAACSGICDTTVQGGFADRCESQESMLGVRQCLDQEIRNMDRALAGALDSARLRSSAPDSVSASERAWVAYRQAQCHAEAREFEGGSLESVTALVCWRRVTRARIAEVEAMDRDVQH